MLKIELMIIIDDFYIKATDSVDIYIIGYRGKGESIVLNIANQFIGVIDSYYTGDNFITKKILNQIGKKVNFICWTHTDEDHTKGLYDLISHFITDKTAFILPEGISCKEIQSNLTYDDKCTEYAKVFQCIQNQASVDSDLFVSANQHTAIYGFNLKCGKKKYKVNIESFAPMSAIVRDITLQSIKAINQANNNLHEKPNLYSVGLRVVISGNNKRVLTFCFTGDLDNITVEKMNSKKREEIFAYNDILKIPHHGSKNCSLLLEKGYVKKFGHAAVTSFHGKSNLPDLELLNSYCQLGEVSFTGKKSDLNFNYGTIHYTIPLSFLLGEHLGASEPIYEGTAEKV